MKKENLKFDCRHFEGHIPCKPNKLHDVQCDDCSHYDKNTSSIIVLDNKESLLQEIFKICNFTKQELVEETPKNTNRSNQNIIYKIRSHW